MLDFEGDRDNISHLIRQRDASSKGREDNDDDGNEEETKSDPKPGESTTKKKKGGMFSKAQKCANQ